MIQDEKIVCTYCKSDNIEYVPAPFEGQSTWFDVRYEQQKNGKFKAVIRGDNGKDNSANVSNIKRNVINFNDARPWFNCNDCSAELDGYNDVDYKPIEGGDNGQ